MNDRRNNYGYPNSRDNHSGYGYDEYDQEDSSWFWGAEDTTFHLWMGGGVITILFMLLIIGMFGPAVGTFLDNLSNNTDFNRYFFTYLVMFGIVFFSKKTWEKERPYFGLRKTIVTLSFLMIGYGAVTGWIDANAAYTELSAVQYPDVEIIYHMDKYFWDIIKLSLIMYLVIVTSWRMIESSFTGSTLNGTLEMIKHFSQVIFFSTAAMYLIQSVRSGWMTATGTELLFYMGAAITACGIVVYEITKLLKAWNDNNDAIASTAIHNYQSKVLELADRTIQDRQKQFNNPEHHKNYGTDFNTVIELKDITEEEAMLFEMDGSKENVLLRIPEGLKVLINISKVPEAEVQDQEKTKAVQEIMKDDKNGN